LACGIAKKLDMNDYNLPHFILILPLHYLVKCSSFSLTVYNDALILGVVGNACVGSEVIT